MGGVSGADAPRTPRAVFERSGAWCWFDGFCPLARRFARGGRGGGKRESRQGGLASWAMCNSGLGLIANAYRPDNAEMAFFCASSGYGGQVLDNFTLGRGKKHPKTPCFRSCSLKSVHLVDFQFVFDVIWTI